MPKGSDGTKCVSLGHRVSTRGRSREMDNSDNICWLSGSSHVHVVCMCVHPLLSINCIFFLENCPSAPYLENTMNLKAKLHLIN